MLEIKDLTVAVEGGREIIKNITLRVADKKCIVITGPNGGGKSTLAKVVAGVERASSGQIFLDGRDITNLSIDERAKAGVAFAFQQPVRFKGVTVRDLLCIAVGDETVGDSAICPYLYDVGLCAKDYLGRELDASLSGGEIKRIEIAAAIARRARLTIFDEPEAGIDIWSFRNLTNVFEKMLRETQGSVIVISHQQRIFEIADEIIVLSDGQIRMQGKKSEILPHLLDEKNKCGFCAGGKRS